MFISFGSLPIPPSSFGTYEMSGVNPDRVVQCGPDSFNCGFQAFSQRSWQYTRGDCYASQVVHRVRLHRQCVAGMDPAAGLEHQVETSTHCRSVTRSFFVLVVSNGRGIFPALLPFLYSASDRRVVVASCMGSHSRTREVWVAFRNRRLGVAGSWRPYVLSIWVCKEENAA